MLFDMIYTCGRAVALGCVGVYGIMKLRDYINKDKADRYCAECIRCQAIDANGKVYCRLEGELDKQPRYCHLHQTGPDPLPYKTAQEVFAPKKEKHTTPLCEVCENCCEYMGNNIYVCKASSHGPQGFEYGTHNCENFVPAQKSKNDALGVTCNHGFESSAGIWCKKRKCLCYQKYACVDYAFTVSTKTVQKTVPLMAFEQHREEAGIRYEQF